MRRRYSQGRDIRACSYVALVPFPSEFAHTVQIMSMCDALVRAGLQTRLHATRADSFGGDSTALRQFYGAVERFEVAWHPPLRGYVRPRWRFAAVARAAAAAGELVFTRHVIAAAAVAASGGRCVLELHSPDIPRVEQVVLPRLRGVSGVTLVAISSRLADLVAARYGLDRGSIHVAHDACCIRHGGAPTTRGIESSTRIGDRHGSRLRAVYAGSFYPGRGVDTIHELARRMPDIDFVAVGGTAEEAGLGPDIPSNLALRPRVPHPEVAKILQSADMLLMPYGKVVTVKGEGNNAEFCSPLKLFEYLAAGRAIVSTRTPSIAEVLEGGRNGLLVSAGDVDAWESALRQIATDAVLRDRLARAALETAAEHTWDTRVAAILEAVG